MSHVCRKLLSFDYCPNEKKAREDTRLTIAFLREKLKILISYRVFLEALAEIHQILVYSSGQVEGAEN